MDSSGRSIDVPYDAVWFLVVVVLCHQGMMICGPFFSRKGRSYLGVKSWDLYVVMNIREASVLGDVCLLVESGCRLLLLIRKRRLRKK